MRWSRGHLLAPAELVGRALLLLDSAFVAWAWKRLLKLAFLHANGLPRASGLALRTSGDSGAAPRRAGAREGMQQGEIRVLDPTQI